MQGIYSITNKINGKIYIGSSTNIEWRWQEHKYALRKQRHCNKHLQLAFNKYNESNFEFKVIEEIINSKDLIIQEQKWIDNTECYLDIKGYNFARYAGKSTLGKIHSIETRKKISIGRKGKSPKYLSKEWKENIGKRHKNKIVSKETRLKIGLTSKDRVLNNETRLKMSLAHKGKHNISKEVREKMNKTHQTIEHKQMMSLKMREIWKKRKLNQK